MEQAAAQDAGKPLTVGKRPCPECGADLEWSPERQSLACAYCGTVLPRSPARMADPADAVADQDLEAALRDPSLARGWGDDRREVQCQSCQAISVFVDGRVAQRCDFCGSPSIIAHEEHGDAITPQSILAFKYDEGQIRERIRTWYGSRWFAPSRLKSAALTDTLHGVYLPYWTFDAQVFAQWRADAGYFHYESQAVRSATGQTEARQVQRVRWEPVAGSLEHFFDDVLVPGTHGVHPRLLGRIEPFPTVTDLK
ncbi:MAG: TFIIB-type zinc ribbon-containing protein, partial [Lautropia sp.]|nr:TFIIB-type zinc ribbon-containing protein [Lautropia sp.]